LRSCFLVVSISVSLLLTACGETPWNNPYPVEHTQANILYTSFSERPRHLDPAVAYSSNEYAIIAQIYEPPLQYHYLRRPYQLQPLTAAKSPQIDYYTTYGVLLPDDAPSQDIAYTDYVITLQPGIYYQPHPAFVQDYPGHYRYHALSAEELRVIDTLADFPETATRELIAEDYVYQIKRLANPRLHSPIAELMKPHIWGFAEFARAIDGAALQKIRETPLAGASVIDRYRFRIRIRGKYPQFQYWLAMPFFAPMPWEAEVFYAQPGLQQKNISLDWFPVGTGPYYLVENNPNRRMTLRKNPYFHAEYYPSDGEPEDAAKGLLRDAGQRLPFIEQIAFILEKESIPYWSKFLQGYYDASGVLSESFDQAVQFSAQGGVALTPALQAMGMQLETTTATSIFYMGCNMLDPIIGGNSERARKLRQALSIAVDYDEYIAIFTNGRGEAAQGMLPPGIYGYRDGALGINPVVYEWVDGRRQRKPLAVAQRLMVEAGYPNGMDPQTGQALVLYFDTAASGPDDRAMLNWYRKQFAKLGIQLVIRATDYNRFQQKMRDGHAQLFTWGWNADYPDPENFFFLLYGPNAKVKYGGENAANYQNPEFDRLFEQMRDMDDGPERQALIDRLQAILREEAPWLFGFHPKSFTLFHAWYHNVKPNLMANNRLKYLRIDVAQRADLRAAWNRPVLWPIGVGLVGLAFMGWRASRRLRRSGHISEC